MGTALADWLGPRWGTVLSMAGRSVLIIAILYVRNFYAVVVIVALVGMIGLVYRPATAALLSELTPKHRQVMIFALYRMGLNVGTTIAPMFGYLLILGSYNLLFWGEAAAGIIYTVIALAALPRRGVRAGDDIAGAVRKRWAVAVFADRRYTLFLGALLINATVYIQYVSVLPLAMRAAGIATFWYPTLLTLNSAIVIGCELLMTKMTQRWPARVVALAGFALLGCGLALYSVPGGPGGAQEQIPGHLPGGVHARLRDRAGHRGVCLGPRRSRRWARSTAGTASSPGKPCGACTRGRRSRRRAW